MVARCIIPFPRDTEIDTNLGQPYLESADNVSA
jgi:hypothetical protein